MEAVLQRDEEITRILVDAGADPLRRLEDHPRDWCLDHAINPLIRRLLRLPAP